MMKFGIWKLSLVNLWLAQRIPDDGYAVAANQVAIQQVDFSDADNFMWAEGIQEYALKNIDGIQIKIWLIPSYLRQ